MKYWESQEMPLMPKLKNLTGEGEDRMLYDYSTISLNLSAMSIVDNVLIYFRV